MAKKYRTIYPAGYTGPLYDARDVMEAKRMYGTETVTPAQVLQAQAARGVMSQSVHVPTPPPPRGSTRAATAAQLWPVFAQAVTEQHPTITPAGWAVYRARFEQALDEMFPPQKSVGAAYALLLTLGLFGAHRFYLRRYVSAVLYIFTLGFLGIGLLVDLILLPTYVEVANSGGPSLRGLLATKEGRSELFMSWLDNSWGG